MKISVREIMKSWVVSDFQNHIEDVARNASNDEVFYFAVLAAVLAGKRAQTVGEDKIEGACADFIRTLGFGDIIDKYTKNL